VNMDPGSFPNRANFKKSFNKIIIIHNLEYQDIVSVCHWQDLSNHNGLKQGAGPNSGVGSCLSRKYQTRLEYA
jgi:hypothetical protein